MFGARIRPSVTSIPHERRRETGAEKLPSTSCSGRWRSRNRSRTTKRTSGCTENRERVSIIQRDRPTRNSQSGRYAAVPSALFGVNGQR